MNFLLRSLDRLGNVSRRFLMLYIVTTGSLAIASLAMALIELQVPMEIEHRIHSIKAYLWAIDTLLFILGGVMLLTTRRIAIRQAALNELLAASEETFRSLVTAAPVLTRVAQANGSCTFFNQPWLLFTGTTLAAASGYGWTQCVHEEDLPRCRDLLKEHLESQLPFSMEYRLRRHDGVFRWMMEYGMPRFDTAGKFLGLTSSCIDMTEQHEKDTRVRELNEALENAVEGISMLDTNLRFISMNSAFAAVLGAGPVELIGQPLAQIIHPIDRQELDSLLKKLEQHGKAEGELRGVRMDGMIFFMRLSLVSRSSAGNERMCCHAFMKDITDELRTRDVIAAHERSLVDYFQNAMVGVRVLDTEGRIIDANRAELNLLGYRRDKYIGHKIQEFYTDSPNIDDMLARIARGENVPYFEGVLRCRNGTKKTVVDSWSGQFDDGEFRGVRCFTQDITDRRLAESLATEHLQRFVSLANIAPSGIFHTDTQGNCLYVNDRWCKMAGISNRDAMGQGWASALHDEDRARVFAEWNHAVETEGEFRCEYRFVSKSGSVFHVMGAACPVKDLDGTIKGYVGTVMDLTETKQSRDDLFKALQTQLDLLHRERSLRQELDHRVRNNLASLMGLVSVYERSDRSTEELARTIRGKISAMVQVHETIARAQGREIDIGVLLETLRQSFIPDESPTKLTLQGPPVVLSPAEASALAMIVQELVTNSMKYGAIASGEGEISLSWNVSEGKSEKSANLTLDLDWFEKGRASYATIEPMGTGVGLSLIEGFARTDLRGSARFDRGVGNWRCHITAELSNQPNHARPIVNVLPSNPPPQELNR